MKKQTFLIHVFYDNIQGMSPLIALELTFLPSNLIVC